MVETANRWQARGQLPMETEESSTEEPFSDGTGGWFYAAVLRNTKGVLIVTLETAEESGELFAAFLESVEDV